LKKFHKTQQQKFSKEETQPTGNILQILVPTETTANLPERLFLS